MADNVIKRSGRTVKFNSKKISTAISKANRDVKESDPTAKIMTKSDIEDAVLSIIAMFSDKDCVDIEEIQDAVESTLMSHQFYEVSKAYILYRDKHRQQREASSKLMEQYKELLFTDPKDMDSKRENANINTNAPMGIMLKLGTEGAKVFADNFAIPDDFVEADKADIVHFHDKDFSFITFNCFTHDLSKLFKDGFNTGHGFVREPNSIRAYASLACIAIQASQNDMFGGQSCSGFEFTMAEGVKKSFRKAIRDKMKEWLFYSDRSYGKEKMNALTDRINFDNCHYSDSTNASYKDDIINGPREILDVLSPWECSLEEATKIYILACDSVAEETHQAMEAVIHNLNTLHSRAGSQVPFSSLNYGMDTSPEGRLVIRELLQATWEGLGDGETPIFPVQVFQLKAGVNYNPEDINYDLFKLAMKVSAKRLFPNFVSIDASFNLPYYKPGVYQTYAAAMGCRTRVVGNVNGEETFTSRGNFAFVTLNLPMIALMAKGDLDNFFKLYDKYIKLSKKYLEFRYEIIARKKVKNFPFVMGQRIYMGSEKLSDEDDIRGALKNSTLSIGYCGLAECLKVLVGKHHGESKEAQELGLKIIGHLREMTDKFTKQTHMNWSTFSTPAESTAGKFLRAIRKKYGIIEGVSDHEYLTNSNHVPVYYKISAIDKIKIEAPYHAFTNAGNISYIELDGDPLQNLDAFETIVRAMHDADMGYFSINHPVDRCLNCGYTGVIENECPKCHAKEKETHSAVIERCHC